MWKWLKAFFGLEPPTVVKEFTTACELLLENGAIDFQDTLEHFFYFFASYRTKVHGRINNTLSTHLFRTHKWFESGTVPPWIEHFISSSDSEPPKLDLVEYLLSLIRPKIDETNEGIRKIRLAKLESDLFNDKISGFYANFLMHILNKQKSLADLFQTKVEEGALQDDQDFVRAHQQMNEVFGKIYQTSTTIILDINEDSKVQIEKFVRNFMEIVSDEIYNSNINQRLGFVSSDKKLDSSYIQQLLVTGNLRPEIHSQSKMAFVNPMSWLEPQTRNMLI